MRPNKGEQEENETQEEGGGREGDPGRGRRKKMRPKKGDEEEKETQ